MRTTRVQILNRKEFSYALLMHSKENVHLRTWNAIDCVLSQANMNFMGHFFSSLILQASENFSLESGLIHAKFLVQNPNHSFV